MRWLFSKDERWPKLLRFAALFQIALAVAIAVATFTWPHEAFLKQGPRNLLQSLAVASIGAFGASGIRFGVWLSCSIWAYFALDHVCGAISIGRRDSSMFMIVSGVAWMAVMLIPAGFLLNYEVRTARRKKV